GSVDLYFGPTPPPGKHEQWVQTAPGTGLFLYFRIYGPDSPALDGTWKPSDLIPIADRPGAAAGGVGVSARELRAVSTPDEVDTRIGVLRFSDGMPTPDT